MYALAILCAAISPQFSPRDLKYLESLQLHESRPRPA